jgi:hypothetical protein
MGPLALVLVGMVTDDLATAPFSLTHHHFLDSQVIRHLVRAPWALEDLVGHLVTSAHRHTQDVLPAARAELVEVVR